ncbi:hypothetical protein HHK36_023629 [Tetracentron sinense]|uniref:25S rRNA (uridine-N(3))-methyltransferase BMT5-like domain-containing protein n=1 Tax=Tetracentron sinense TaxID=13715 RepID=A0A834YNJ2_TETSI|nr:hypothetical protein HHK36_023629 [Tetracentron sinense]
MLHFSTPLLHQKNSSEHTPLHVAAWNGRIAVINLLIKYAKITTTHKPLWRMENWENNTALHEALRNSYRKVAVLLLDLDPAMASSVNRVGESPLYLAAEACLYGVLCKIINPKSFNLDGSFGRNLLHAAIFARSVVITRILARTRPELINFGDNSGKTALHYAAAAGTANTNKNVRILLMKDTTSAYVQDIDARKSWKKAIIGGNSIRRSSEDDNHIKIPDVVEILSLDSHYAQDNSSDLDELEHNHLILRNLLFRSASGMLRPHREIHVNHKTTPPFCHWNLEELASLHTLPLTECTDFKREDYLGYDNKRGAGPRCDEPFRLGECSIFKFRLWHNTKKMSQVTMSLGFTDGRSRQIQVRVPQMQNFTFAGFQLSSNRLQY